MCVITVAGLVVRHIAYTELGGGGRRPNPRQRESGVVRGHVLSEAFLLQEKLRGGAYRGDSGTAGADGRLRHRRKAGALAQDISAAGDVEQPGYLDPASDGAVEPQYSGR